MSGLKTSNINGIRRMFNKQKYMDYNDFYGSFQWNVPSLFNAGYACCDYHINNGNENNIALYDHNSKYVYKYKDLYNMSNKLCNFLSDKINVNNKYPDRIGVLLSQSIECGISHLSIWKAGCISMPLFTQFGNDAIEHRLNDSEASILITNKELLPKILGMKESLPYLKHIIITGYNCELYCFCICNI